MSRIIKQPFNFRWGDNILRNVTEVEVDTEVDREDYNTLQGQVITVDGARKASVGIMLLASDIPALAAIMPQYFVPNGGVLSTGETVNHAEGAIDISAATACDENEIKNNLDIESCGNPSDVFRLVNARTSFEEIEFDKVRMVKVLFIAEPEDAEGIMQFFRKNTIAVVS